MTTPVLKAERFSMRVGAGGLVLLRDASFSIEPGELVMVVGPSGAGKSLLFQLVAGVLAPDAVALRLEGRLSLGGHDLPAARTDELPEVGLVFQDHALFDDLSPRRNLEFAVDHRHRQHRLSRAERRVVVDGLIEEFGLAGVPHVRALSGGQRQRLAVARSLAHAPSILIYDEPTTGLDPLNAERVAESILRTHREHDTTSVVITHDYAALLPIADRVLLLDPRDKSLRPIEPSEVDAEMRAAGETRGDDAPLDSPLAAEVSRTGAFFRASADVAGAIASYFRYLVPTFPRLRWGAHFFVHQLRLVAFPSAMIYMVIAGVILGVVSTYFTFRYLPHKHYTGALLTDDILAGLGLLNYRVLAPTLATILVAARCGAAVAADLGNRTYARQLDAMRSFGIRPDRYLFTAVIFAFLIGTPVLCGIVYWVAEWFSQLVFVYTHLPQHTAFFWDLNYRDFLLDEGDRVYRGTWWALAKVEVAGAGVAAIAYHLGVRPKRASTDVSGTITSTIIWATLWVLATHFVFAFFEF